MKLLFVVYGLFCFVFAGFAEQQLFAQNENRVNIIKRDHYMNSKTVFESTHQGRVAFLGGSITEMDGFRPMVCDFLQEKFPQTTFDFINAGISSTCSTTGAFRLKNDVLSFGKIDLFFVEFAVNDDQDAHHSIQHSIRGMEGIIRHIRKVNPDVDIVMIHFVNENLMDQYRLGKVADSIAAHETVAKHYHISTINLAKEITEEIDSGQITWEEFGGVHPAPRGNRICVDMIKALLLSDWNEERANNDSEIVLCNSHNVLNSISPLKNDSSLEIIDPFSYVDVDFLSWDLIQKDDHWTVCIPDWKSIPGAFRDRFADRQLFCADQPGSQCSFSFYGTVVGAYLLAGPDAGILEFQIDDQPSQRIDLFHHFSSGLHYPRSILLADELENGPHSITITVSAEKNRDSNGNAARILEFLGSSLSFDPSQDQN
ncbi:MAG: GDSL-type esterase/lipase family protein [Planctomycetia bacterium]|nr:GDSL-type esterase/lipase family protein [Planctomycetia bacterium]